jgi:hypothetical protein
MRSTMKSALATTAAIAALVVGVSAASMATSANHEAKSLKSVSQVVVANDVTPTPIVTPTDSPNTPAPRPSIAGLPAGDQDDASDAVDTADEADSDDVAVELDSSDSGDDNQGDAAVSVSTDLQVTSGSESD